MPIAPPRLRPAWPLLLLALAALSGCCCETVVGDCRTVSVNDTCKKSGECGGNWLTEACFVESAADCRAAEICTRQGRCGFDETASHGCIALTARDCLESTRCRTEGACTLVRGACEITDPGCSRSEACRDEGRCKQGLVRAPDGAGMVLKCIKRKDDGRPYCHWACRGYGACTHKGDACLATTRDDCRASVLCEKDGACALDKATHTCVARTRADCEASERCTDDGRCRLLPGGEFCFKPEVPCEDLCDTEGRCHRVDGVCQPSTDADCEASIACRVQGRCGASNRLCKPRSDADCAASEECAAFGRCETSFSTCVAPDEPPQGPYSTHLCLRDPACRTEGRCLRAPDGTCVPPPGVKNRGDRR